MPGSENLWGGERSGCAALFEPSLGVFAVTKTWDAHSRVP